MMAKKVSKHTTDHKIIQKWVEERDGRPSIVRSTATEKDGMKSGLLRIDFPGGSGEGSLEEISWDEWFKIFDDHELVFLYEDETADGKPSRFNKLVSKESVE